jgi:hypothetical protein
MRQDKTNTEFCGQRIFPAAANGVQRRQTRAGVPKKQFPASKKKKEGESAFSAFIGFYFIYTASWLVRLARFRTRFADTMVLYFLGQVASPNSLITN